MSRSLGGVTGGGPDAGLAVAARRSRCPARPRRCSTASPSSSAVACSRATAAPSSSATASGPKRPGAVGFSGSAATPVTRSSGSGSSRSRPRPKRVWRAPRSDLRRAARADRRRADVALPRPRGGQLLDPAGSARAGDEHPVADRLPVLARVRPARPHPAAVTSPSEPRPRPRPQTAERAKRAVSLVFALNGFCFAGLVSRFPDLRGDLDLEQRRPRPAAARDRGRLGARAALQRLADPALERGRGGPARAACWSSPALVAAPLGAEVAGSVVATARRPVPLRRRHRRLGRRDERRGRRGRAAARADDHAAVPRRLQPRHHHRRRRSACWSRRVGVPVLAAPGRSSACSRWCCSLTVGVPPFLAAEPEHEDAVASGAPPGWSRARWRSG